MKFLKQLVNRIKAGQPIPIKAKQAMVKTIQRGKSLPASIKSALVSRAIARKAVPAAMVRKAVPAAMFRKAVPAASMVRRAVPAASMVRRAVPQKGGLFANIKKLIQTTNPSVVKAVSPVQRSFMPVDLPYETMSKKQTAIRIPATNFAMPTNIDLIQPPVDGGTSNYYGK